MPRRLPTAGLAELLVAQDQVVTRAQAYTAGLTRNAVANRVRHHGWQELLPNVFLAHGGGPARRQRLIAALLFAGEGAAIDSVDAARFHGVRSAAVDDRTVHVVVPATSPARSTSWVVVRRTSAEFSVVRTDFLRYVDVATAVVVAARGAATDRGALALLSESVQRRLVTTDDLLRAHVRAASRNARRTDLALRQVRAGVRSAPEGEFRLLAEASAILPTLLYNALLRLPDGRLISPDALALDAGLVHETNGRSAHARQDLFEDMQERHDAMTAAGLTVLHNSPRRVYANGREVLAQMERCYLRLRGSGLPPGVVLVRPAARAS